MKPTHFGHKPHKDQMKAFIQLRVKVTKYHNKHPVYKKLDHTKDELIDEYIRHMHLPLQPYLYDPPIPTQNDITTNPTQYNKPNKLFWVYIITYDYNYILLLIESNS